MKVSEQLKNFLRYINNQSKPYTIWLNIKANSYIRVESTDYMF